MLLNTTQLLFLVTTSSVMITACGPSAEEKSYMEMEAKAKADSVSIVVKNLPKSIETHQDSGRVFIRNADLQFKVKDVKNATFEIERIVNNNKGYVTNTDLESNTNYKNTIRVSKDSVKDIIHYTVQNNITIRVPNESLDKTLSEIAAMMDYVDYRKIKADDVTKQIKSAKLTETRLSNHKKRLEKAIDHQGKKLNQTVDAENDLLAKQEYTDDTQLNTMELLHDVAYSTINIQIYQREISKTETYLFELPIEPYEPNFFEKTIDSLSVGAKIFGEIFLFLLKLWPIFLIGFSVWFVVKSIAKKTNMN